MQQKTLVLFDFDGTLTKGDSLLRFMVFAVPLGKLPFGMLRLLFAWMRLIWTGAWSAEQGKAALLSVFFKGKPMETLQQLGSSFYQDKIPGMLRPDLLATLREYLAAGATVAVVSASVDIWLRPFCVSEHLYPICTELAYAEGKFTGKFSTPNCTGREKVRRIRATFDLNSFEQIIAFGNSTGDAEMLALADEGWLMRKGALIKVS